MAVPYNDLPSLGSSTGTRLDSAAKHIMACKMDSKLISSWLNEQQNQDQFMHQNKLKFCMHKDEIVMNTSRRFKDNGSNLQAYPLVLTTLGNMLDETKKFLKYLYGQPSASQFHLLVYSMTTRASDYNYLWRGEIPNMNAAVQKPVTTQIEDLPDFRCQGVALGQAFASYLSGDTVASVFVGGMVTVQNGAFPMNSGDLVQWYFDFEAPSFEKADSKDNGVRSQANIEFINNKNMGRAGITIFGNVDPRTHEVGKRQKYMDERLYGGSAGGGSGNATHGVKDSSTVMRIKSYKPLKQRTANFGYDMQAVDHYGDKCRVFAKCISGGRAFDAVDIMIMTQSS